MLPRREKQFSAQYLPSTLLYNEALYGWIFFFYYFCFTPSCRIRACLPNDYSAQIRRKQHPLFDRAPSRSSAIAPRWRLSFPYLAFQMLASFSPGSCGRATGSPAALPHTGFPLVIRRQSRVTGRRPRAGALLPGNGAPGYIWDYGDSGKDEDGDRHITSSKMWHGVGSGACRSDPSSANLSNLFFFFFLIFP